MEPWLAIVLRVITRQGDSGVNISTGATASTATPSALKVEFCSGEEGEDDVNISVFVLLIVTEQSRDSRGTAGARIPGLISDNTTFCIY